MGVILLLSGCVSNGLLSTSSNIKGDISQGVYTGEIGSQPKLGKFSIFIPQTQNSYEYLYMQAKQQIGNDYTYVSFGPGALDFTVFRVMVGDRQNTSLETYQKKSMPMVVDMAQHAYKQPMKEIAKKRIKINGKPAIFEVYTQHIPGRMNIMLQNISPMTYTHAIAFVDYGKFVVMFWIQAANVSGVNAIRKANRSEMANLTWKPMNKFIRSFKLH
jgi:hypothetical protein